MADFATERGHWYTKDGTPCYTIVGKNGSARPTTLRDARAAGLLPGVTGIIKMAARPGLEKWMRDGAILSALTLPRIEGESSDHFLARVDADWKAQGKAAADKGTAIHGAIEKWMPGKLVPIDLSGYAIAAWEEIDKVCAQDWTTWSQERSFACSAGYGGKVDLHSDEWVVDIKTKETINGDLALYDEHLMQLAAYRFGLGGSLRGGILFVGRDLPSAKFVEASKDDLDKGEAMFFSLLSYWQAKNRYAP